MEEASQSICGLEFDDTPTRTTLFGALVAARKTHGGRKVILEDQERNPYTYNRLILSSLVLGRKLAELTETRERVGVLLPTAAVTAVVFFGLNAFGRIPAMLNFTSGTRNLQAACESAGVRTIVTSRRFVEHGHMEDIVSALSPRCRMVWLEDVAATVSSLDKMAGVFNLWRVERIHARYRSMPDDEAVILFTSGSEGVPKGVVLSNANLIANALQILQHAGAYITPADIMFDTLPVFHAFGLTAGLLLGLYGGCKVILYVSPLHYKQIPKLIAATGATFVFSTDTFIQHYAKAAGRENMSSVRYAVAGAEAVRPPTRKAWQPYNAVILEGYGATECSPVIAVNLPGKMRDGTVGTLLPGIEAETVPVEGVQDGGRLRVRGPNVMQGYVSPDSRDRLAPPEDGWYDTGDIVAFDGDGFITIKGRAKRFAKIGGEMVSLAAVEAMALGLWPDAMHAAVALPDAHRGEQIVLLTTQPDADREALLKYAQSVGFPELCVPKGLLVVDSIPLTGMGKTDYIEAARRAESLKAML
ncbi:MAG: AMP-binding protein [Methylobacteriaceae bacterium]|jgi:acyl-[acyl-carrier-protein]-phospholipid O-acyltransferase/long-chain-fatty-acid--[acyl-carrier-protein] ligase|nr:AMP-binding protein [Methylobacteriaceae bacterium]